MAWNTLRTLVNRAGVAYDALKTSVIFAEDMNKIKGNEEYLKNIVDLNEAKKFNSNFCKAQLSADQIVLATTGYGFRLEADSVVTDTDDNYIVDDWYGADGAFEQANSSGCSSSNIQIKAGSVPYPIELQYCLVEWASTSDGVTNYGKGYINTRIDASNLNISKVSGADFANNYYYRIRKIGYVVPVTGLYQIISFNRVSVAEDQKRYNFDVLDPQLTTPIPYASISVTASGVGTLVLPSSGLVYLTAGQFITQRIKTYGLSANLTLSYLEYQNFFSIMLVRAS